MRTDNPMPPSIALGQDTDTMSFFGEPYGDGEKTVVPLVSTTSEGGTAGGAPVNQVAIVMIEGNKVSISHVPSRLPIVLTSLVLGCWNAYWLLKTLRVWRRQRQ